MKRKNKKAIEMGFDWIFAIIAGVFILFIAIYATSKFIYTSEKTLSTETAAKFVSLVDPLETGLAAGKSSIVSFKKDTKTFYKCDSILNKPFGKQTISFVEKTFGEKYGEEGSEIPVKDKYIFTENMLESKEFYLFSEPFFMPFKISDLIIIYSNYYCFYNTPEDIKSDVEGLNLRNIDLMNSSGAKCNGIKVCFDNNYKCDIKVSTKDKYVQKDNKKMFYYDTLIYGAIFASPEIYECNVKRLMGKFSELSKVYIDKIKIIERKQCESRIGNKLDIMMENANKLTNSKQLIELGEAAEEIDIINEGAKPGCKLYQHE